MEYYVVQENRGGLWCDEDTNLPSYEKALESLRYRLYEARKHKVSNPEDLYRIVKRIDTVMR